MNNYFTDNELKCKCGCNQAILAPGFRKHLNELRRQFGKPMIITSGCRCRKHNKNVGGSEDSFHLMGKTAHKDCGTCAVDINIKGYTEFEADQLKILAFALGWTVGIDYENKFIHIDLRSIYAVIPSVIFSY